MQSLYSAQFLAVQNAQYKPYTQSYEQRSDGVRTFNELRMRRIRESQAIGEVWRKKQRGIPEHVNFRRVSAFKLDNGEIDR